MTTEEFYNMDFLEKIDVGHRLSVIRVPGGWIFEMLDSTTFVPFDNEFMNNKK